MPAPKRKTKRMRQHRRKSRRSRALVVRQPITIAEQIEKVLISGDLTPLTPEQRVEYFRAVCKSLGLNPLTRPFAFIPFKATDDSPPKLMLYALKDCTEQLRKLHGITVEDTKFQTQGDMQMVTVQVRDKAGRTDAAMGVVSLSDKSGNKLKGLHLANAIMRAETKAKRRATLSISGLGMLDESELDGIENTGTFAPSGRMMFEAKTPTGPTQEQIDAHDAKNPALKRFEEREAAQTHGGVPSLFYQFFPASGMYEITGAESLKTSQRDLLVPLFDRTARTILAKPEQLGKLIAQFEDRKIPFKELLPPGAP